MQSLTAPGGVLDRIAQTLQLRGREERDATDAGMSMFDAVTALQKVTPGNALIEVGYCCVWSIKGLSIDMRRGPLSQERERSCLFSSSKILVNQ